MYYKYFLLLTICIGLAMTQAFSQEQQTQEPQTRIVRGPRQLKNSDFIAGSTLAPPDEWMKGRQEQYNGFLKFFLWNYHQVDMTDRYSGNLDMSGLQKLEWVVKTNKTTYQPGEPIGISVSVRNISTEDVKIAGALFFPGFMLNSMEIKKVLGEKKLEINLTGEGAHYYGDVSYRVKNPRPIGGGGTLKPGDVFKVYHPYTKTLNLYYDLSQTGEYELTFYTRNFLGSDDEQIGEFPKPCTIRFKIEGNTNWLDSQVVWPEEVKSQVVRPDEEK